MLSGIFWLCENITKVPLPAATHMKSASKQWQIQDLQPHCTNPPS